VSVDAGGVQVAPGKAEEEADPAADVNRALLDFLGQPR
jgi:hypothetical protein